MCTNNAGRGGGGGEDGRDTGVGGSVGVGGTREGKRSQLKCRV